MAAYTDQLPAASQTAHAAAALPVDLEALALHLTAVAESVRAVLNYNHATINSADCCKLNDAQMALRRLARRLDPDA